MKYNLADSRSLNYNFAGFLNLRPHTPTTALLQSHPAEPQDGADGRRVGRDGEPHREPQQQPQVWRPLQVRDRLRLIYNSELGTFGIF